MILQHFFKRNQRNGGKRRQRAGRKPKALTEKISEGKTAAVLMEPAELEGMEVVRMVEQYAMSVSRWIQCEEIVSSTGFLAKHPTTGAATASPYVSMSQSYMKQTNYCWIQIYQIVKVNCSVEIQGNNPQDDVMERLIRASKGV